MRPTMLVFVALLLLCVGHAAYYYPQLPEQVASHFDAAGRADGWSSKSELIVVYMIAVGLQAMIFGTLGFVLPKIPIALVNVPNRQYYLAPERATATLSYLSASLLRLGIATQLLLLYVFHLGFLANMGVADAMHYALYGLIPFAVFLALWLYVLLRRFRLPSTATK